MVESMAKDEDISEEDAIDWIDYNTLRTIPYMPEPKPVVMYKMIK